MLSCDSPGRVAAIAQVAVPLYLAEIAPARLRGPLVGMHQLGIGAGFTIAYLVGWAATDGATPEQAIDCWFCGWRLAAWIGLVPTLLTIVLVIFLPESPR